MGHLIADVTFGLATVALAAPAVCRVWGWAMWGQSNPLGRWACHMHEFFNPYTGENVLRLWIPEPMAETVRRAMQKRTGHMVDYVTIAD